MVFCLGIQLATLVSFLVTTVLSVFRSNSGISLSSLWLDGPSFQEDALAYGIIAHIDTIDGLLKSDVQDDALAWVVTDTVDAIVETAAPGPKQIQSFIDPVSLTSTALSVVVTSPNVKIVPKVVQVVPTLGMVTTIQHTPQPSGTSIAFAQRQTPFLIARSNPQDRFFNRLVIVVFLGLAVVMGVLVLLSLDSGIPPAVFDFLLLSVCALREEAAIVEVVGVVSLVWRLLFKDEVSEANMPTAEREEHGADSSLSLGRQLTSNTTSVNVAYGKEHFQTIVRQSIGSKLYICWDKDTSSVVEDVILNPDVSVCTLATVSRSASCDNLRAFASMPFFSSVNSDGEESVIETPSQAVIRTKLVEDPVSESQAEVFRTPSIPPAISDLDVASLARTETVFRQATVELEGPRPSLFSTTHSETGNYLLSLPESYVPVRVDGFFALQQEVGNMSLMHAPALYSLDSVPDAATSGSLQAAVDDDAKSQPAVAPPSSPSPSRRRKASYAPPLQPEEAHTPATTRPSPSRNTACPGKRAPRVEANPSVRPSPSKHAKDLRSSPPALKRQQQKEQGPSPRRYGHHTEGMARIPPPRPSNPVLPSTSPGNSREHGSSRTSARAAALPTRKGALHVQDGQPRQQQSTPSRSSQQRHTPSRFPVRAPKTRSTDESGSPVSRARRCSVLGCFKP